LKVLPQSLINELHGIAAFNEQSFLAAHQQAAVTSVWLHPVKHSAAFKNNEQVPWCGEGRYLAERPIFTLDPAYHAGAYYVQEASSMFLQYMLQQLLPDTKNLRVLDLCAAPGGKSTLIASMLDSSSLLISNEVIRTRASILEENMTRWGYMNTWVTSNDPRTFSKLPGYFDVIVVDAPCSGSGLFRKDERALEEWSEANVQLCSQRQQRILADVWPALKEDGILIYATCSYSPQEDEEILDWLCTEFDVESMRLDVPESFGVLSVNSSKQKANGYRFFPDKVKGEGFFIAALRKKENTETVRQAKFKSTNDKKVAQQAGYLLSPDDLVYIHTDNEQVSAMNPLHELDWQLLQQHLFLRKAGLALGSAGAKEWIPAHEVALSINAAKELNYISVNKEQALKFLKKEEMPLVVSERGWYVVSYEGLGLGWIKSLGNRINNYLPKHWRIRMEITDADWA